MSAFGRAYPFFRGWARAVINEKELNTETKEQEGAVFEVNGAKSRLSLVIINMEGIRIFGADFGADFDSRLIFEDGLNSMQNIAIALVYKKKKKTCHRMGMARGAIRTAKNGRGLRQLFRITYRAQMHTARNRSFSLTVFLEHNLNLELIFGESAPQSSRGYYF
ncbi:hypothetical protein B0H19DRAFT_1055481 [Mycena capillaripes]|nr:hypothetical protein B0H19DRAFT_1055481 [Mycena capillaripes]